MDWTYNTIWFEQIPAEVQYKLDCKESKLDIEHFLNTEYLIIWYLKQKEESFDVLPTSNILKYLELNSANIKKLSNINKFPTLKRLELHYCTKLESVSGIELLESTLEYLHINQSKKLSISTQNSDLNKLKNLKVLCLNSCGDIDDLSFLSNFPELVDFRFVDTKVLSGDLRPILEHPNLRTVSFLNKRHYNFKSEEMSEILKEKFEDNYRDELKNGDFITYKYNCYKN